MPNHIFPSTFYGSSWIRPSHVVKERQYKILEFAKWQRAKWAKIKYGRIVYLNSLHCISKSGSGFRWLLYWLLHLSSSRVLSSLAFNSITEKCWTRYVYLPPLTLTGIRSMKPLIRRAPLVQSRIGARWSSGHSCDPSASSYNTCFLCTTVEHRRKIYRKIQWIYIAQRLLWIVRVSYSFFFICDYFGDSLWTMYNLFDCTIILPLLLVR